MGRLQSTDYRTTVEVSHVAAGEHMVPGPFHSKTKDCVAMHRTKETLVFFSLHRIKETQFERIEPLKTLEETLFLFGP
jgi:hypothetical protein